MRQAPFVQNRRTADGWKISATGYDRTYQATMSLKNLNFKTTPGRALRIEVTSRSR